MRSDNLVELCKHEFAELIDDLFQMNRDNGHEFLRTPITNRLYSTWDDDYIFKLKRNIYTALAARKWFREHGPSWAPLLPLTFADIDKLKRDESGRINLVGLYASSLSLLEYDYKTHPPFDAYARGLMAYAHTPSSFRDDPELVAQFSPKPLAGIDAGLNWQTPEMIARHLAGSERAIQRLRDQNASEKRLREWIDEHEGYFGTISR